jgi:hypothetical protein
MISSSCFNLLLSTEIGVRTDIGFFIGGEVMRAICLVGAVVAIGTIAAENALAQETAKGLLAVQLRAQGYRCDKPISAKRDEKRSRPDVAVWVVRCEHRSYNMTLLPDMAARVQQLK